MNHGTGYVQWLKRISKIKYHCKIIHKLDLPLRCSLHLAWTSIVYNERIPSICLAEQRFRILFRRHLFVNNCVRVFFSEPLMWFAHWFAIVSRDTSIITCWESRKKMIDKRSKQSLADHFFFACLFSQPTFVIEHPTDGNDHEDEICEIFWWNLFLFLPLCMHPSH